ncbi:V-type ATP synthase subunit E 2-like [Hydra vulgaris]|uniref:V-type ATP synthase subunit E 2-like n=1 Tax=Hydra vulgaris TaxID=6087 RepID=A0ABM4BLY0_HYDVU
MDITMKNIEKMISSKLEEHKKSILKETERLFKDQEKSFTSIISANLKIITDRLDMLENDIINNKCKISNIEKDLRDIKDSLNFQENNISEKISQIKKYYDKEINSLYKKSIEKAVKEIFKTKLKIQSEVVVERAHRIGQFEDNKPRTLVIKLLNFQDKNKILNAVKYLKGTDLYINEDFAQETIYHRRKLWEEVKKLRSEDILLFLEIFR